MNHAFLYIFLLSLHDYDVKLPIKFYVFWREGTQGNDFL